MVMIGDKLVMHGDVMVVVMIVTLVVVVVVVVVVVLVVVAVVVVVVAGEVWVEHMETKVLVGGGIEVRLPGQKILTSAWVTNPPLPLYPLSTYPH